MLIVRMHFYFRSCHRLRKYFYNEISRFTELPCMHYSVETMLTIDKTDHTDRFVLLTLFPDPIPS